MTIFPLARTFPFAGISFLSPLPSDPYRPAAQGPALGLRDTKVGTFTQALYDEAKKDGWFVKSKKND